MWETSEGWGDLGPPVCPTKTHGLALSTKEKETYIEFTSR